jgi:hypothetical protein
MVVNSLESFLIKVYIPSGLIYALFVLVYSVPELSDVIFHVLNGDSTFFISHLLLNLRFFVHLLLIRSHLEVLLF